MIRAIVMTAVILCTGCAPMIDMLLPDMSPPCNESTRGEIWDGRVCVRSLHNDGYEWGTKR